MPSSAPLAQTPDVFAVAEQKLSEGAALEAVALLLREGGSLTPGAAHRGRLSILLAQAAEVLAASGDIKAAAVAADSCWQLNGRPVHPRTSLLLSHYAASLVDAQPQAARAIAERALVVDPDNRAARDMATALLGTDSFTAGHLTLGAGVGLGVLAASAFVFGLDIERQARGSVHDSAVIDQLLFQRGLAAAVAWPAIVGAVVLVSAGLGLIAIHDPRAPGVLPPPFKELP